MESMDECILSIRTVPQWYGVMEKGRMIAGIGVIENDFHERKDLMPNVCALYVEEEHRSRGIAGKMLSFVCDDMGRYGIDKLYLITDHTSFYERYGWRFLCMVNKGDSDIMTRMYVHQNSTMSKVINNFNLVKPCEDDEKAVLKMVEEWRTFGGRMNPGLLRKCATDYNAWLKYLDDWDKGINTGEEVPQTLFLLKDDKGDVLGAASLRHFLNETNIVDGGHVGYGICPKYRGKGYGNIILALSLLKLKEMKIERVLVTCDSDNIASQKVILKNGGVLENHDFDEDGIEINRYWIDNSGRIK